MVSTETRPTVTVPSPTALDAAAFVVFAVFVALLLLGYLGALPGVPFTPLAAATLAIALALLLWANLLADRREALSASTDS